MWKYILGGVIVIVIGSVAYSEYVTNKADEGVVISPHIKGNESAAVTLVEYSDFQCPACKQFVPHVDELVDSYGDQLSFEYRHFPLSQIHANALPAAIAAEAAGQQGAFFPMHDMLFERQSEWAESVAPNRHFREYARELGLDVELFERHLNSRIIRDAVEAEAAEALAAGYRGTPTFILNGERMQFDTFEAFTLQVKAAIDAALGTSTEAAAGALPSDFGAAEIAEPVVAY